MSCATLTCSVCGRQLPVKCFSCSPRPQVIPIDDNPQTPYHELEAERDQLKKQLAESRSLCDKLGSRITEVRSEKGRAEEELRKWKSITQSDVDRLRRTSGRLLKLVHRLELRIE